MIGEKDQQFQGKGTDLNELQGKIESYLQSEGFTVQTSPSSPHGTVIQAKKGGFLSGGIAAETRGNRPLVDAPGPGPRGSGPRIVLGVAQLGKRQSPMRRRK